MKCWKCDANIALEADEEILHAMFKYDEMNAYARGSYQHMAGLLNTVVDEMNKKGEN